VQSAIGVARNNGEREIQMADNTNKKLTEKMKDELRELKKANRVKEREKQKRIKLQAEKQKMEEDIAVWKVITKLKETVDEQLKGNPLIKRYNIKQISNIPDYYEYQHPDDAKQKGNDKNVDWVKKYLSAGGTERQLLETATESRVKLWRRISWKRPIKTTSKSTPSKKSKIKLGAGGVG